MPIAASEQHSEYFFILASGSPRRKELIKLLGIPSVVIPPSTSDVDETPLPDEAPALLVQRLSQNKALAIAAALPSLALAELPVLALHPIIVAADTVVVLEDQILGKPSGPDEARQMLKRLRQRQHLVYTGFTIALPSLSESKPAEDHLITRLHQNTVWMRAYTDIEIEGYIERGSPLDKAGAYGIQDHSFGPVGRLDGCFASVMGLPIGELAAVLRGFGLPIPTIGPRCSRLISFPCCQK